MRLVCQYSVSEAWTGGKIVHTLRECLSTSHHAITKHLLRASFATTSLRKKLACFLLAVVVCDAVLAAVFLASLLAH